MIYRFRLISDENDQFLRVIEIEENDTFLSLHQVILSAVEYDDNQMTSFFVSNKEWEKGTQITLVDMGDDDSDEKLLMDEVKINEHIKSEEDTLMYVYDFIGDKAFYLFLAEIKEEESGIIYPLCTNSMGEAPEQIIYDDEDVKDFLGDDYYVDEDEDADFYATPTKKKKVFNDDDDLLGLDDFGDDFDDNFGSDFGSIEDFDDDDRYY
jgi:hypothetical protein